MKSVKLLLITLAFSVKACAMHEDFGQEMSVATEYEQPRVITQPKTAYAVNTIPAGRVTHRALLRRAEESPYECQPVVTTKYNKPSYLTNFSNWLNSWFSSRPQCPAPAEVASPDYKPIARPKTSTYYKCPGFVPEVAPSAYQRTKN